MIQLQAPRKTKEEETVQTKSPINQSNPPQESQKANDENGQNPKQIFDKYPTPSVQGNPRKFKETTTLHSIQVYRSSQNLT